MTKTMVLWIENKKGEKIKIEAYRTSFAPHQDDKVVYADTEVKVVRYRFLTGAYCFYFYSKFEIIKGSDKHIIDDELYTWLTTHERIFDGIDSEAWR